MDSINVRRLSPKRSTSVEVPRAHRKLPMTTWMKLPLSEMSRLDHDSVGPAGQSGSTRLLEKLHERARTFSTARIADGVNNDAMRAQFATALHNGRLSVSIAEVIQAVIADGDKTLLQAISIVRDAWEAGSLQLYGPVPDAFRCDFSASDISSSQLSVAVLALRAVQVSPVCSTLSWPLLRAILLCFKREQLRSSFSLILDTCRNALALECTAWDLIAAVSLAEGHCDIDVAPWPIEVADGDTDNIFSSVLVTLSDVDGASIGPVFPPYSAALRGAVESEYLSSDVTVYDIELWLQSVQQEGEHQSKKLSVPLILASAASQQNIAPRVSGGAFLWFWEKMSASSSKNACGNSSSSCPMDASLNNRQGTQNGMWRASGEASVSNVVSCDIGTDVEEHDGSDSDDDEDEDEDEDDDDDGDEDDDGRDDDTEELTPLEALIACFSDDLRNGKPLFLSQLNNLYGMRSGGRAIKYRSHGYNRMGDFLSEVPGMELVGTGNQMAVKMSDPERFEALAELVTKGLQQRIAEAREKGADTRDLEIRFHKPQAVPKKILERVWDVFQRARDHEIPVQSFVALYKERYFMDKLHFKALGYQDVRGLLSQVPFIEKIGGRRHAKYVLRPDAVPPEGYVGKQRNMQENPQHQRFNMNPGKGGSRGVPCGQIPFQNDRDFHVRSRSPTATSLFEPHFNEQLATDSYSLQSDQLGPLRPACNTVAL